MGANPGGIKKMPNKPEDHEIDKDRLLKEILGIPAEEEPAKVQPQQAEVKRGWFKFQVPRIDISPVLRPVVNYRHQIGITIAFLVGVFWLFSSFSFGGTVPVLLALVFLVPSLGYSLYHWRRKT
jgi:hypothetical protein